MKDYAKLQFAKLKAWSEHAIPTMLKKEPKAENCTLEWSMSHAITCEGKPDVFMTVTYRVGPNLFRWEGGEVKRFIFDVESIGLHGKRLLSQGHLHRERKLSSRVRVSL